MSIQKYSNFLRSMFAKPKPNYRGSTNDFPAQVNYLGVLSRVRYAKSTLRRRTYNKKMFTVTSARNRHLLSIIVYGESNDFFLYLLCRKPRTSSSLCCTVVHAYYSGHVCGGSQKSPNTMKVYINE